MGDALPSVDLGTVRSAQHFAFCFALSCALLDNGQVKCWGNGGYTLGLGVPANMTGVGDNPGEMGDALPVMNLAAPPSGSANETKAAAGELGKGITRLLDRPPRSMNNPASVFCRAPHR